MTGSENRRSERILKLEQTQPKSKGQGTRKRKLSRRQRHSRKRTKTKPIEELAVVNNTQYKVEKAGTSSNKEHCANVVLNQTDTLPFKTAILEKSKLELLLSLLRRRDSHKIFANPVDPKEVEGYYDVIKKPMDFSTISKKLNEGSYDTLEDFEEDVFLVSSNAMLFNATNTIYYRQARAIKDLAKKLFWALKSNPAQFEAEYSVQRTKRGRRIKTEVAEDSRSYDHSNGNKDEEKCVDRRDTYNPLNSSDKSILSTVYDSPQVLKPVGISLAYNAQGNIGYLESLKQFVKDLGPIAESVAKRKAMCALTAAVDTGNAIASSANFFGNSVGGQIGCGLKSQALRKGKSKVLVHQTKYCDPSRGAIPLPGRIETALCGDFQGKSGIKLGSSLPVSSSQRNKDRFSFTDMMQYAINTSNTSAQTVPGTGFSDSRMKEILPIENTQNSLPLRDWTSPIMTEFGGNQSSSSLASYNQVQATSGMSKMMELSGFSGSEVSGSMHSYNPIKNVGEMSKMRELNGLSGSGTSGSMHLYNPIQNFDEMSKIRELNGLSGSGASGSMHSYNLIQNVGGMSKMREFRGLSGSEASGSMYSYNPIQNVDMMSKMREFSGLSVSEASGSMHSYNPTQNVDGMSKMREFSGSGGSEVAGSLASYNPINALGMSKMLNFSGLSGSEASGSMNSHNTLQNDAEISKMIDFSGLGHEACGSMHSYNPIQNSAGLSKMIDFSGLSGSEAIGSMHSYNPIQSSADGSMQSYNPIQSSAGLSTQSQSLIQNAAELSNMKELSGLSEPMSSNYLGQGLNYGGLGGNLGQGLDWFNPIDLEAGPVLSTGWFQNQPTGSAELGTMLGQVEAPQHQQNRDTISMPPPSHVPSSSCQNQPFWSNTMPTPDNIPSSSGTQQEQNDNTENQPSWSNFGPQGGRWL